MAGFSTSFQVGIGPNVPWGQLGQRKVWFPSAINIAQLPSAIAARERQAQPQPESQPERVVVAPVPVADVPWEYVYPEPPPVVRPVLPGPVAARPAPVPREIVVVEGVSTEVERHPQGDFPAGSIFAPGQTWGVSTDLDTAPDVQEDDMAIDWGGLLDWGLDTIAGQQPWQTFGSPVGPPSTMNFAAPNLPVPSGIPGQPTTITGYSGGTAVTNGDNCGNRRYVTLDRETGKISCKRRRRRRLLTNRDLADLASLKTITGGGAALNAAVIRAVR